MSKYFVAEPFWSWLIFSVQSMSLYSATFLPATRDIWHYSSLGLSGKSATSFKNS